MYCKKCGCRLKDGEPVCSNCGAKSQPAEYSNGFWDLYQPARKGTAQESRPPQADRGRVQSAARQSVSGGASVMRLETQLRDQAKELRALFRGMLVLTGILLLLIGFLFLRSCSTGSTLDELDSRIDETVDAVNTLQARQASAESGLSEEDRTPVEGDVSMFDSADPAFQSMLDQMADYLDRAQAAAEEAERAAAEMREMQEAGQQAEQTGELELQPGQTGEYEPETDDRPNEVPTVDSDYWQQANESYDGDVSRRSAAGAAW